METTLLTRFTHTKSFPRGIEVVINSIFVLGLVLGLTLTPIRWAGAGLVAALVIATVVLAPAAGLVLIAVTIPFGHLVTLPLPGIGLVDGLIALTLLAWLLRGFAERRVTFQLPPLMWPLLAFVWVAGLSLTQAGSWQEGVPEWLKWGEFAVLYLVATQILRQQNNWKLILTPLFLAGISQAALGAYQFIAQAGPEEFILFGRFMRAYGTFEQPNPYAGYLGYLTPVTVSLSLAAGERWWAKRQAKDLVRATVYALIAAVLGAGILISWSRGAWMGLAASLVVVVGLRNRRMAALMIGSGVTLLLLITLLGTGWLPESLTARIGNLSDPVISLNLSGAEITDANFSVLERVAHWQAGLKMFTANPWLGVGIGNYAVAYATYAPPPWYTPLGHAHNIFINFLAETGAIGLAAFSLFWLSAGYWLWRRCQERTPIRAIALGALGAWTYLTVHSMFDNLFVQHMQLQLALLLSVVAVESRSRNNKAPAKTANMRTYCVTT